MTLLPTNNVCTCGQFDADIVGVGRLIHSGEKISQSMRVIRVESAHEPACSQDAADAP